MRGRTSLVAGLAGLILAVAPAAQADDNFGVASASNGPPGSKGCTTPIPGGNLSPSDNQPCWVAGVYSQPTTAYQTSCAQSAAVNPPANCTQDYTGMNDTNYYTMTGGHPFIGVTDFMMSQEPSPTSPPQPPGSPPNGDGQPAPGVPTRVSYVRVDVPAGLTTNPQAVPYCDSTSTFPACPPNTQLGIVELEVWEPIPPSNSGLASGIGYVGESVYNMKPGYMQPKGSVICQGLGQASDFAFYAPGAGRVDICGGIRSGSEELSSGGVKVPGVAADDGDYFEISAPPAPPYLIRSTLIFWGVPGDPAHGLQSGWSCVSAHPCVPPADAPSVPIGTPFLTLPSGCLPAGQVTTLTLRSSQSSAQQDTTSQQVQATSSTPVAGTGCQTVPFDPSLSIKPDSTNSDAPTGATVDLHVPQSEDPSYTAQERSLLKDAVVTLPPGMTLDPSAANGLQACSPAQFAKSTDAPPACPAASQVGTVTILSPLLSPSGLTGKAYLGCDGSNPQTPCPASDGLADLYVYASGQGVTQKLVGTVTADPFTGQVTTTFSDLPQQSFSDFILNLKDGATAPLANPLACGTATMTSSLTPYSGNAAAHPSGSFKVDKSADGGKCTSPAPFAPGLSWSAQTLRGGAFDRPLTVTFTRSDGDQYLGLLAVQMPPGLVGIIPHVPLCREPQASLGTCGHASQIGTATVLAGSGPDPITQVGRVYLTGPYGGGPFGLSIVTPAIAGPFNLGIVVTRAAIDVDKSDAHLTIVSTLPQIVGGIPLRIRQVSVRIDRPRFVLNPTSCGPLQISAIITSTQGGAAAPSDPFQAFGCGALGFHPSLKIALTGNGQTTDGKHPTLTATLASRLGQANVRLTRVTLPLALALDPYNSEHVCSVAAAAADRCPAKTIIGHATAKTPLLNTPLSGRVYLVQGIRINAQGQRIRTLPTLLVALRGQVAIDLRAQTSVDAASRLVTTFQSTPDTAFSRFVLTISGGRHGILVVTHGANVCRGPQIAPVHLVAQSGKTRNLRVRLSAPCRKAKKTGHHKKNRKTKSKK